MSTYHNRFDNRRLETWKDGGLVIRTDDVRDDLAFTPRPEDRPVIALEVLGEVENPGDWATPENISSDYDDDDLIYLAYRNLKALAIRRERATKAEAEDQEADAQLDREALALLNVEDGHECGWDDWGNASHERGRRLARAARDLHMEAGK